MPSCTKLLPVLALVAISAGCGSSPSGPSASGTSVLSNPASTGNASTLDLGTGESFSPAPCEVRAVELSLVLDREPPSDDRTSRVVQVDFKGDPTNCPKVEWTTSPTARLVVDEKLPNRVRVYDPGDKYGIVDVTASLPPNRLTATVQISFPRQVK